MWEAGGGEGWKEDRGEVGENKRVKEEGGGAHGHQWG